MQALDQVIGLIVGLVSSRVASLLVGESVCSPQNQRGFEAFSQQETINNSTIQLKLKRRHLI